MDENVQLNWRAGAVSAALAVAATIVACETEVEDDPEALEFRDGCDGVDEYIDEDGNYVVCVYPDDDGGDGGYDGGDPCWQYPWLCYPSDDGGYDGGYDGGDGGYDGGYDGGEVCWGTFTVGPFTRTRSAVTESAARYDARWAVIEASQQNCAAHTSTFCTGAFDRLIGGENGPCYWNGYVFTCSYTSSARCRWTF
jgi:hypothetical protein